jgi:hypothetical protein
MFVLCRKDLPGHYRSSELAHDYWLPCRVSFKFLFHPKPSVERVTDFLVKECITDKDLWTHLAYQQASMISFLIVQTRVTQLTSQEAYRNKSSGPIVRRV